MPAARLHAPCGGRGSGACPCSATRNPRLQPFRAPAPFKEQDAAPRRHIAPPRARARSSKHHRSHALSSRRHADARTETWLRKEVRRCRRAGPAAHTVRVFVRGASACALLWGCASASASACARRHACTPPIAPTGTAALLCARRRRSSMHGRDLRRLRKTPRSAPGCGGLRACTV